MKRIIVLLAVTAILVLALAVPAFAQGKPQGKVEQGLGIARSICSASGLNDEPEADFPEDGQVQSYGQLVKKGLKAEFPNPGVACNPNTPPSPE